MPERVFFYGTLRTGFNRTTRAGIDEYLKFTGRGWIDGKLFDLGIYPAAVPATDARVRGEVFEITDAATVLTALDRIEGYRPGRAGAQPLQPRARAGDARRWAYRRCVGVLLQCAARPSASHHVGRLPRAPQVALSGSNL